MSAFSFYILHAFSVFAVLARPFESKSGKFMNGLNSSLSFVPRDTIFCVPHCVGVVAHGWFHGN